jgi:hypothetical protein
MTENLLSWCRFPKLQKMFFDPFCILLCIVEPLSAADLSSSPGNGAQVRVAYQVTTWIFFSQTSMSFVLFLC